jgi:hypothetical protein
MVATPSNAMNLNSIIPGLVNWDGVASMTTTPLTQYSTLVAATANTVVNITPGTAGQVLTSNGASSNPAYAAVPFNKRPWNDEASSFNALAQNGYVVTASATATLPASPLNGDEIDFIVKSVAGILTIQANTGQFIQIGKAISVTAGIAVSNFNGDSVNLVYDLSTTTWLSNGGVEGTFTVT